MFALAGYQVLEKIFDGANTTVFRASRQSDQMPVILKVLSTEYPTTEQIKHLKKEYEITKGLDIDGIVQTYQLEPYHNRFALVIEDSGGESLDHYLKTQSLDLSKFFKIAIQLASTLAQLHQKNILHKDIKPSNIIIHPESLTVKIADFSVASTHAYETGTLETANHIQGTLAYISPEQTGRTNRAIDYRTDLYSLGVTFYEVLVGELPFAATEPMELVHCHIAKRPIPPHVRDAKIPVTISAMIMKLLEKPAENRYQHAYGLQRDLENCLAQWEQTGRIESFVPGLKDHSGKLSIPDQLYGRETELSQMRQAFNAGKYGEVSLLLITGNAGIGKSSLVQEFRQWVVAHQGHFISGAFEQIKQDRPYAPLIQAFQELIRHLLLENKENLLHWKNKLLHRLGEQGQLIIEVIPELELMIGAQPEVPELPVIEAQNRFHLVFQHFVEVFSQANHPLVIYLDDLQWADSETLTLLQHILTDQELQNLLCIGSYRENEVTSTHALPFTLEEIKKSGIAVHPMPLAPFTLSDIQFLLQDTLSQSDQEVTRFASILMEKTGGNPLFITLFLNDLYEKNVLVYDFIQGRWQWDLSHIQSMGMTANVVDLMTAKILKLSKPLQTLLSFAACLGRQFDLQTIAELYGKPVTETAAELWIAIQEGMLVAVSGSLLWKSDADSEKSQLSETGSDNPFYQFLHDRVQQAAYALMDETGRIQTHLKIGYLYLEREASQEDPGNLFEIVNQLNLGRSQMRKEEGRTELARLNLIAGTQAKSSAAYAQARDYFQVGMELLPENNWHTHYELTFLLHWKRAECEFIHTHFTMAESLIQQMLQHAQSTSDKVKAYVIRMEIFMNHGHHPHVIETGFECLKLFGIEAPAAHEEASLFERCQKLYQEIGGQAEIEELSQLPSMEDPAQRTILSILNHLGASFYAVGNNLFYMFGIYEVITRSIKYGNCAESSLAYTGFGMMVRTLFHDFELGVTYAETGVKVAEQHQNTMLKCRVHHIFGMAAAWRYHLTQSIHYTKQAFQYALESGDLTYAGFTIATVVTYQYLKEDPVDDIERETQKALEYVQRNQDKDNTDFLLVVQQTLQNFKGNTISAASLTNENLAESQLIEQMQATGGVSNLAWYYAIKLGVLVLQNHVEEALKLATEAEPTLHLETVGLNLVEYLFYYALTLTSHYANASEDQKTAHWEKLKIHQEYLDRWAQSGPENFLHKALLVQAEIARIANQPFQAMKLYQQAIDTAQTHGYFKQVGIAHELAARHHIEQGFEVYAKHHIKEAFYAYQRIGISSKVDALAQQYPHYLQGKNTTMHSGSLTLSMTSGTLSGGQHSALDLMTVMKGSQAISGEIVLEHLLRKLIHILIENAGAEKGAFILEQNGQFYIEAEGRLDHASTTSTRVQLIEPEELDDIPALPVKIIKYVAKTKAPLILDHASQEGNFQRIPYVMAHQTKSVLCAPILYKNQLSGIIYLENNMTTGAFTSDRLEVVNLLSAQAAISLENARLYEAYERFVPHEFLQLINRKSIIEVHLGDQIERTMSILFSDIRSFTSLSEQMTPQENFNFLNSYLKLMGPVIRDHDGFIDKYIGDAIMALFSKSADDAVQAAIGMQQELIRYNQHRSSQGYQPIEVGIGINTGTSMLGTIGEANRMEGTVISDAVNLASRIEGLTKQYGASILISEYTLLSLKDATRYALRFMDQVTVKGKEKPIKVYEIFDADLPELKAEKLRCLKSFEVGWRYYQKKNFAEAIQYFEKCVSEQFPDPAARLYILRCQQLLETGVPENWDGTTRLDKK